MIDLQHICVMVLNEKQSIGYENEQETTDFGEETIYRHDQSLQY
jgi:hypothetical protein